MSSSVFDGLKIFSATMAKDRAQLGERITTWLGEHPEYEIVDKVVTQSSDNEYHRIAITLFWRATPASGIALDMVSLRATDRRSPRNLEACTESSQPLALAVGGGLTSSTILSLLFGSCDVSPDRENETCKRTSCLFAPISKRHT